MDSSNSQLCSQNGKTACPLLREDDMAFPSLEPPPRLIDPPHARSLIFSSPLYCIGASDHLASITAFMSDCLLLRLRLTLHDPLPPSPPPIGYCDPIRVSLSFLRFLRFFIPLETMC